MLRVTFDKRPLLSLNLLSRIRILSQQFDNVAIRRVSRFVAMVGLPFVLSLRQRRALLIYGFHLVLPALPTHAAKVSASFRQGMTIETSGKFLAVSRI